MDNVHALVNRLLAIIFLVLVVVAVADLWLRYAEAGREGRRNAENLVGFLSEYLEIRLGAVDGVLLRVVASSRRIGRQGASEREWATALRTAISGVTGLRSIVITDADGIVAYSTAREIVGESWAARPIFRKLSEGHPNLLVADAPLSIGTGNEKLIPFGRALTDPRGEFIGTVVATLVPDQLQDFYRAFDLGQSGVAWVLLPSGFVLFRQGSTEGLGDVAAATELPVLATGRAMPSDGFIRGPLGLGGSDYLTTYRRTDIANLVVAVSLSEKDLLSKWWFEALVVLIFIVVAGVFLFFARRRINDAVMDAVESARAEELPDDRQSSSAA